MNHGKRSLPHYPFGVLPIEMEYESRGFIDRGFLKGLNPRQFFFHAMSGREGVCDTAMLTAVTGYIQRKIVKLTEDMIVSYDGTVIDSTGRIYQLSYGQDGIDPTCTIGVDGKQQIYDVNRIINRLHMEHGV